MVILCGAQIASMVFGLLIEGSPFILFVIAPYIAIALGAGWFSEVRRYAGEQKQAADELRRLETALETMQIGVSITDAERAEEPEPRDHQRPPRRVRVPRAPSL